MSDHETLAIATTVCELVGAVNRGDFSQAAAAFGPTPTILKDIAPYS